VGWDGPPCRSLTGCRSNRYRFDGGKHCRDEASRASRVAARPFIGSSPTCRTRINHRLKNHMTQRIYNFSAGPAVLPESVLREAQEALWSLGNTGIGILEHSHRGKAFLAVYHETVALLKEVAGIPD